MTRMLVFLNCLIMLMFSTCYALNNNTKVAFYYGLNPPLKELQAYEAVIVNPQKGIDPKLFSTTKTKLYAYISVGEVEAKSDEIKQLNPLWFRGENPAWSSRVMDMANPGWRDYLLNTKIKALWEKGYRGFFLDTLDSYQLLKLTPEQIQAQQAGIIEFIKNIKVIYPDASLIINRGFAEIAYIHQDIDAIAAESLFHGWNATIKKYEPVSEANRKWLIDKLNVVHYAYNLPIIIIDYVAPEETAKARQSNQKINELGFIPTVTDSSLATLGMGKTQLVPRKILLLYEETPETLANRSTAISAFLYAAFPLQFMGFVPVLQPVDSSLPNGSLRNQYAGIIAWFEKPVIKNHQILENWLTKQVNAGLPLVFMENFGLPTTSPLLQRLNITVAPSPSIIKNVKIIAKDKSVGFELLPQPVSTDFAPVTAQNAKVLLKLKADELQEDAIAITPWGGYVLGPFAVVVLPNEKSRWVIDPFLYFRKALRLPLFPSPDVTTATGKRILTVHIDGDAFISRVTWLDNKYTADVLLNDILKLYKIPTTVSVIQREFELLKNNNYLTNRLTGVAKEIFALPWVQLATHTYSHPLAWGELVEDKPNFKVLSYPSKDYLFNYKTEIAGSTDFINSQLAPADKKVTAVFWSGDGNINQKPLEIASQIGIKNVNGMAGLDLKSDKSLTNVSALGLAIGNYFQVFAPIPNEFEYTDEWSQPLYAFQNAIHSFELTDKPTRFKPMSIYYHFYIATDQAALRSLKRVYDWTLKQNNIPLYIAEYISKVNDFNRLVIDKDLTQPDSWYISNNSSLRELRWPMNSEQLFPDLDKSKNVIGFNKYNNDLYIHLGPQNLTRISLSKSVPIKPYLIEANAEVMRWETIDNKIIFALKGHVPLSFKLANMNNCHLEQNQQPLKIADYNNNILQEATSGIFEIHCQGSAKD
ncbi:MAG: endo alpha-1,4 polygalactosaminidase [Tatlockia sp.]|nr:endo alpha-1,4 polygalactosaminidase [Tatlockia sp.]